MLFLLLPTLQRGCDPEHIAYKNHKEWNRFLSSEFYGQHVWIFIYVEFFLEEILVLFHVTNTQKNKFLGEQKTILK